MRGAVGNNCALLRTENACSRLAALLATHASEFDCVLIFRSVVLVGRKW